MQDLERRLVRRVLCFRVSPDRAAVNAALTIIEDHFQAVVPIDALAAKQHLAHDNPDVPEISFLCEDVRVIRFLWSQPERRQRPPTRNTLKPTSSPALDPLRKNPQRDSIDSYRLVAADTMFRKA